MDKRKEEGCERNREGERQEDGEEKMQYSSTHAANTFLPDLRGLHF